MGDSDASFREYLTASTPDCAVGISTDYSIRSSDEMMTNANLALCKGHSTIHISPGQPEDEDSHVIVYPNPNVCEQHSGSSTRPPMHTSPSVDQPFNSLLVPPVFDCSALLCFTSL